MNTLNRNPLILLAAILVSIAFSIGAWQSRNRLSDMGLSIIPTASLETLRADNSALTQRVNLLEKRLELLIWLSRECHEIRSTMDEEQVHE